MKITIEMEPKEIIELSNYSAMIEATRAELNEKKAKSNIKINTQNIVKRLIIYL